MAKRLILQMFDVGRGQLKCDETREETRFCLSAKRTRPFKSAGGGRQFSRLLAARGVRISGSNAGYTVFRGSVKSTGYTLHSPVSSSLPLPCVTIRHHISTAVYHAVCLATTPSLKQCLRLSAGLVEGRYSS